MCSLQSTSWGKFSAIELTWWHYFKWKELKGKERKAKTWVNYPVVSTTGYSEGLRTACLENRKGDHLSTASCSHWSNTVPWNDNSLVFQVYACMSAEWFGRCPKPWLQKDPGVHSKWYAETEARCCPLQPFKAAYCCGSWSELRGRNKQLLMNCFLFSWFKSDYAVPILKSLLGLIKSKLLSIVPKNSQGSHMWPSRSESSFFLSDPVLFMVSGTGTYRSSSLWKYGLGQHRDKNQLH